MKKHVNFGLLFLSLFMALFVIACDGTQVQEAVDQVEQLATDNADTVNAAATEVGEVVEDVVATATEVMAEPTEEMVEEEPTEEMVEEEATDEPMDEMEAQYGGTAVVAVGSDPGHFNPGLTTGFNVHAVTGSIFNGLVELDDNANPHPDLATSWEISDDSTTYTFHLAEGVTWHDGEPFTSADVKFTFEEVLLNFHSRTKSGLEGILSEIQTPDDNTVVFVFAEPYAALLQRLNSTEAPILPMHIYAGVEDIQTAEANLNPIGTGPFILSEYTIDDTTVLIRNENYFKEELPYLDQVIFRVIPEDTTQLLALEQGEVDFIWRVPGADLQRLQNDDAITMYQIGSGPGGGFCIPTLTFNLDREYFQDVRVRRAFAHAINRQQLLEQAAFGQGRVATGPISSRIEFAYTDDVTDYPLDIDMANQLLDEAGLERDANGTRLTIDLLAPSETFAKYGEVVRGNLIDLGIEVEVMQLDRSAFLPSVFTNRDFDTNIISYCNNSDPSIGVSRMYISTNIGDIPFSNGAGYVNPTIDELFTAADQVANPAARGEIYAEIQQILTEEVPYWWLVETDFTAGASNNIHGLQPWSGHVVEMAWLEQ